MKVSLEKCDGYIQISINDVKYHHKNNNPVPGVSTFDESLSELILC